MAGLAGHGVAVSHIKSAQACAGKVPYSSRREAAHELRNQKRAGSLKPYPCRECGKWHIGHQVSKSQYGEGRA